MDFVVFQQNYSKSITITDCMLPQQTQCLQTLKFSGITKCDTEMWSCQKNGPARLAQCQAASNLKYAKNTLCAKCNEVKHCETNYEEL